MKGRPAADEAAEYYFRYIGRVAGDDALSVLEEQARRVPAFLRGIGEDTSLHSYAEGKWTLRAVLGHVNDSERVFQGRAWWFARGQAGALSSFDPDSCALVARADDLAWARHVDEFEAVRASTLALSRATGSRTSISTNRSGASPRR